MNADQRRICDGLFGEGYSDEMNSMREQCERRDGALVHRRSGKRVKAIMPVHLYGQMVDMNPVMQLAKQYDLRVIEDAAHSLGTTWSGKNIGTIGKVDEKVMNGVLTAIREGLKEMKVTDLAPLEG